MAMGIFCRIAIRYAVSVSVSVSPKPAICRPVAAYVKTGRWYEAPPGHSEWEYSLFLTVSRLHGNVLFLCVPAASARKIFR